VLSFSLIHTCKVIKLHLELETFALDVVKVALLPKNICPEWKII
jgi:hypothetical protein